MSDEDSVIVILGVIGALAALAAVVAAIKGRSSFGWLVATLVFPPLLLLLFMLPSVRGRSDASTATDKARRQASGKSSDMPSWTQPAPATQAADASDALQQALARAGAQVESEVGKRILGALANRAAQQAKRSTADPRRSQQQRPTQQPKAKPTPQPTLPGAEPARSAAATNLSAEHWKPQTSAVQRSGSRETRIYRRT